MEEPRGWSYGDKCKLYIALKNYKEDDLDALQRSISHKTVADIRNMIDYYKLRAQNKWVTNDDRKSDEIKKWIDIFEKLRLKNEKCIHDIVPRALKYIALFEKRSEKSDINLRDAYIFLSRLCNGSANDLPERADYFLYKCLVSLAENLQDDELEHIKKYLLQLDTFQTVTQKPNVSVVNLLGVPDELLTTDMSSLPDINE